VFYFFVFIPMADRYGVGFAGFFALVGIHALSSEGEGALLFLMALVLWLCHLLDARLLNIPSFVIRFERAWPEYVEVSQVIRPCVNPDS
jgi:hypothetical protein